MRVSGLLTILAFAAVPGAQAIVRPKVAGGGPKNIALAVASTEAATDDFIKVVEDTLADSPSAQAAPRQNTKPRAHLLSRRAAVRASARSAVSRGSMAHAAAASSSVAHVHHALVASGASAKLAAKAAAGAKWSSVAADLWASLVLRQEPEAVSFEDDDAETKAAFLDRCNQTFDVPAFAVPDEVVSERCLKVGGTDTECTSMVDKLWTAFNATGNVNPWCDETYDFFEQKTVPKCLGNCKADLCDTRCTAHDKLRDLQDKETSLHFKLNQSEEREEALELDAQMHALKKTEMEDFNRTNCTGFKEDIAELEDTQAEVGEKFAEANETFTDLLKDEHDGHETLRKLYEADAPDADVERARERLEATLHSLSQLREVMGTLNSRLVKLEGQIGAARSRREYALKRLGEMEADYLFDGEKLEEEKEKNEKRKTALEEALEKLETHSEPYEEALSTQLAHDATSTAAPAAENAVALRAEASANDDAVDVSAEDGLDEEAAEAAANLNTDISDEPEDAGALGDVAVSTESDLDEEVAADLDTPVLVQTEK